METLESISKLIAHVLQKIFGSNALSDIIDILVFLTLSIFIWYIDPLSMRFSSIRSLRRREEKYAGNYLQIVQSGAERRYSVLIISYDHKMRKYKLDGRQYDPEGNEIIDFNSEQVSVVEDHTKYSIEFPWTGGVVRTERYEGFTKMMVTDPNDLDMIEGNGFFITFDEPPRRVNLKFLRFTPVRLKEFGLSWPSRSSAERNFVREIHSLMQHHPELEPSKLSSKPPLI